MGEKRRILNIIIIHFEEECVVLFTASVYRSALSLSLFFFSFVENKEEIERDGREIIIIIVSF